MTHTAHEYPIVDCKMCGKSERAYFVKEVVEEMVSKSRCHSCLHWDEWAEAAEIAHAQLAAGNYPCKVIVRSEYGPMVYGVGPELPRFGGLGRGYGGSEFIIEFDDGRRMASSNLWSGSEIPQSWLNDPRFKPMGRMVSYYECEDYNKEFGRLIDAGCFYMADPEPEEN